MSMFNPADALTNIELAVSCKSYSLLNWNAYISPLLYLSWRSTTAFINLIDYYLGLNLILVFQLPSYVYLCICIINIDRQGVLNNKGNYKFTKAWCFDMIRVAKSLLLPNSLDCNYDPLWNSYLEQLRWNVLVYYSCWLF